MKRIFTVLAILTSLLASCAPKIAYTTSVGYIDYQNFANNGMYLTESNLVSFEYVTIGLVSVTVFSGEVNYTDFNGNSETTQRHSQWKIANSTDAISLAVDAAKKHGGNGIINLKVVPMTGIDNNNVQRTGLLVTGTVIKK